MEFVEAALQGSRNYGCCPEMQQVKISTEFGFEAGKSATFSLLLFIFLGFEALSSQCLRDWTIPLRSISWCVSCRRNPIVYDSTLITYEIFIKKNYPEKLIGCQLYCSKS